MENVLSVGMGIHRDEEDHKLYGVLQLNIPKLAAIAVRITNEDNYEQDIAALIGGLMQLRADFKEESTGLIVAKGADDASLRNPQGGKQRSTRSKST